jgi:hypothetical protein
MSVAPTAESGRLKNSRWVWWVTSVTAKLVQAREGVCAIADVDAKLGHELADIV